MLKNLFSSALSSVGLGAVPNSFGYNLGDAEKDIRQFDTLWKRHRGISKADLNVTVTILVFDKKGCTQSELIRAQNECTRLRTLRHPNILKVLDLAETDAYIYLATESVTHLFSIDWDSSDIPLWGLFEILSGAYFVLNDCKLFHGRLDPSSIWVTPGGSFKLAGFDIATPREKVSLSNIPAQPALSSWPKLPSGAALGKWQSPPLAHDVLGCLFITYFFLTNGVSLKSAWREQSDKFWELMPEGLEISRFIKGGDGLQCLSGILESKYLRENAEVRSLHLLANIHVSSESVALAAIEELPLNEISVGARRGPLVDLLARAAELPRFAPAAAGALVQVCSLFSPQKFQERMQPIILKLAALADRGVRYKLVTGVSSFADLMEKKAFEKEFVLEIFSGFSDSHPAIREATLRAVLVFAPKLKPSAILQKLLPHVSRLQRDPEAPIRIHACIAVGKIASLVEKEKIPEIIIASILPCLADPFDQTKLAAVAVIQNLHASCSEQDLAVRILPALCPLLIDRAAGEAVFDLIKIILDKTKPPRTPKSEPVHAPAAPQNVHAAPTVHAAPAVHAAQPRMPKIKAPVVKKAADPADDFWAELEDVPKEKKESTGWDLEI